MSTKWMVTGAVLLVAGAAAPWTVGYVTEQQWQGVTAGLNDSQEIFRLETRDYNRGYMNATVVGSVTFLDPETGEKHAFDYQADVSHGVTGSLMDFSRTLEESMGEDENIFPDEKPTVTLETRVWGSAVVKMTVPELDVTNEETGETFTSSRFEGQADISSAGQKAEIHVEWPGMEVTGPEMNISLADLTMDQTMEQLVGDVWLGDGDVTMASLKISAPGQPAFAMSGLSMTSSSSASDNGERMSGDTTIRLESVSAADDSFGPHEIQFSMENIDVAGLNELSNALSEMQNAALTASPDADPQAMMQQQMASFQRISSAAMSLATEGFTFGFPKIDLATPEGPVNGEIQLSHPELSDEEKAQTMMVMQGLTGNMEFSMPVALVEMNPALNQQVAPLIKQGMVVKEGDRLRVKGTLADMALTINGNVMPLPPIF